MDSLRRRKIEIIVDALDKLYKNQGIRSNRWAHEWTAEILLERLEEVDVEEFERAHDAQLETKEPF